MLQDFQKQYIGSPQRTMYTETLAPAVELSIVSVANKLSAEVSLLHEQITILENRLEPILGLSLPTPENESKEVARKPQSTLFETLTNLHDMVLNAQFRLNDIRDRAQL